MFDIKTSQKHHNLMQREPSTFLVRDIKNITIALLQVRLEISSALTADFCIEKWMFG